MTDNKKKFLSQKEIDLLAIKILEDYDAKNPGTIFKKKIKLTNHDGLALQSKVTKLRINRGEKVIGYKIGCVAKETQKKWDLHSLHGELFGGVNYLIVA